MQTKTNAEPVQKIGNEINMENVEYRNPSISTINAFQC